MSTIPTQPNNKIKMVVFDMAGTTVNEDNVVYKTLRKAINEAGYSFTLQQVLAKGAGKEKKQAIKDILAIEGPPKDDEMANQIYQQFLPALAHAYQTMPITPMPGAEQLFAQMHQQNIGVVLNTGYDKQTATTILQKLNWQIGQQIDAMITASQVASHRPKPDMILLAMQQMSISDAATVAKVGDSAIDILEGKNAGCGLTIGITTGAHSFEQLLTANPNFIIHHLADLLPLLT